jgi:sec-independent protein translocase protein TatC
MARDESAEEARMPITGHLEELRKRIMVSLIAVGLGFAISLTLTTPVLKWLEKPLGEDVYFFSPTEAFWTHMKVAFFSGLFLASPVVLYEGWRFIAPGLYRRERRYALLFVLLSLFFLMLGLLFCAFIALPFAMQFLISFGTERGIKPLISIGMYIDFTLKFYLAFGVIFQLPLALTLLARMGFLTASFLARHRKYAFLINAVAAAILTPTSDIFNMMLMLIPLTLLYELGILGARVFGAGKRYAAGETERHAGAA